MIPTFVHYSDDVLDCAEDEDDDRMVDVASETRWRRGWMKFVVAWRWKVAWWREMIGFSVCV